MRRATWVIGFVGVSLVAAVSGCGGGSSGGGGSVDLSTPKAAMKTVMDALRRGDAATIKEASINGDPAVIDMMASMVSSMTQLQTAAVAKFGEEGKNIMPGQMPDFDKSFDDADVKEDGDNATVTPKSGSNNQPAKLKKVDGKWKLDMAEGGMPKKADLDQMGPMFTAMSTASKEVAADITAGKYKTAAEAKAAMMQKMMGAAMGGGGGAPKMPGAPAAP